MSLFLRHHEHSEVIQVVASHHSPIWIASSLTDFRNDMLMLRFGLLRLKPRNDVVGDCRDSMMTWEWYEKRPLGERGLFCLFF